ncbi:alpha/beta hydrolase [Phenylobacterium sp.]|jgi:pimeloyl-ACP methyl ester carboxylesterase|uniref:alpha/beta fold hydrolase n=1 Tax=Phenylobacterium sp. TaxID=1871053 RepID=UPI002F92AFF3
MLLQIFQRLFALASLAVLAFGGYLIWSWFEVRDALGPDGGDAFDTQAWRLWLGGALVAWSFLGKLPVKMLLGRQENDWERLRRLPGATVTTPTGAKLHVERSGPEDAPVLVFVHGWGLEAGTWWEARQMLSERYQVVTYDLAGLGKSTQFADRRYSLEKFADDLLEIVGQACPRKVILVGHSIGGMIIQTFCRRYPETLNRQVAGIVLENTTHEDPSRTTVLGEGLHAIKPLLEVAMRLDIPLQPLVWLMNWQSYLSGNTHLAMRIGGFGTQPTKAQLEQVALAATRNPPAVQAKGNLAMMHWEATGDLPTIRVPALVFVGGKDIVTVPAAGETIARRLPQAKAVYVEDAGHLGPMELAETYNAAIASFADEVFTRGARYADGPVEATTMDAPDAGVRQPPQEPRPFM